MLMAGFFLAGPTFITVFMIRSYQSRRRQRLLEKGSESRWSTDVWSLIASNYPELQERARLRAVCKAARRIDMKLPATGVGDTTVRLVGLRLGRSGAAAIMRALGRPSNASVDELQLHSCRLGVEGARVLAMGIRANPWVLRGLSISEDDIGPVGVTALREALAGTWVDKLVLDDVALGDDGACELAELLGGDCRLTELSARDNAITTRCAFVPHVNPFDQQQQTETLPPRAHTHAPACRSRVSSVHVGSSGARALGAALADNTSLTSLDLRGNGCGDEGALALSDVLAAGVRRATASATVAAAEAARARALEAGISFAGGGAGGGGDDAEGGGDEDDEDDEGVESGPTMLRVALGDNGVSDAVRQRVSLELLEAAGAAPARGGGAGAGLAPALVPPERIAVAEF